jgi:hypothetical protein
MSALEFFLVSLATWRVARMVIAEDGPADVFSILRHKLGVNKQETWIQRGLGCLACVSFWLALAASLTLSTSPLLWRVIEAMAISAVSVIMMRKIG